MKLKIENENFAIFFQDILFVVANYLDLPSLASYIVTCQMAYKASENRDIWLKKKNLHFPTVTTNPPNNPLPNYHYTLFLETSKNIYRSLTPEMKNLFALVVHNDLAQIEKRQIKFTDRILRSQSNKYVLWQWVRKNQNQALNDYIFNQLLLQNYSFEINTKWAMILDQTEYFKQHTLHNLTNCLIDKKTLLYYCVQFDLRHAALQLLTLEVNPDITFGENPTPLYLAIQKERVYFVELLLRFNASTEVVLNGLRAIHIASEIGNLDIVKCLHNAKVHINARSQDGKSALHFAMDKGKTSTVQYLLENDADMFARFNKGHTPLHLGSISGKVDAVKAFLKYCKNDEKIVNAVTEDGVNALDMARKHKQTDVYNLLLEAGAASNTTPRAHCDINLFTEFNLHHAFDEQTSSLKTKSPPLESLEEKFQNITNPVVETDYSFKINELFKYYENEDAFFNLKSSEKNSKFKVLKQLLNLAPNHFGPICCLWLTVCDRSTPYQLQETLMQDFNSTPPQIVLTSTLENYLASNIDLLTLFYNNILPPITKRFQSNIECESPEYEEAISLLHHFEIQLNKILLRDSPEPVSILFS